MTDEVKGDEATADCLAELDAVLQGDTLYNRQKLLEQWKERWLVEGVMTSSVPRADLITDHKVKIAKLAHEMLEALLGSMRTIPGLIEHKAQPTLEGLDFTIRLVALLAIPRPPPSNIITN